jgi:hypothetical protein
MHFKNIGDVELGHAHDFDHGTLVSSGSILVEILDSKTGKTISNKTIEAPNFVFIEKNKTHRITALSDNTVCACIHALRTNDEELLEPDFFVEQLTGDSKGIIPRTIMEKSGKQWLSPAI